MKWHSYQINSQDEGGHFPDPKTSWSHSSHCLSVHTGNIKAGSKFSTHSFPTCLEPLALHTVSTVAVNTEPAVFIFRYQISPLRETDSIHTFTAYFHNFNINFHVTTNFVINIHFLKMLFSYLNSRPLKKYFVVRFSQYNFDTFHAMYSNHLKLLDLNALKQYIKNTNYALQCGIISILSFPSLRLKYSLQHFTFKHIQFLFSHNETSHCMSKPRMRNLHINCTC